MELISQLENRFDGLLQRIRPLEQENQQLSLDLEADTAGRQDVQQRVEALLKKIEAQLG
jgi:cell division protein ZapB